MKEKRKYLKANGILLGLTALFLGGLLLLDHYDGRKTANAVETEKTAVAEITEAAENVEASEIIEAAEAAEEPRPEVEPVCLNTASAAELERLPGIGPELARRILEYRDATGPFLSVEELTNISGIGAETLAGLRDYITIDGGGER